MATAPSQQINYSPFPSQYDPSLYPSSDSSHIAPPHVPSFPPFQDYNAPSLSIVSSEL